jgi:hypothetical protein
LTFAVAYNTQRLAAVAESLGAGDHNVTRLKFRRDVPRLEEALQSRAPLLFLNGFADIEYAELFPHNR